MKKVEKIIIVFSLIMIAFMGEFYGKALATSSGYNSTISQGSESKNINLTVTTEGKVFDYAELLSEEEENTLNEEISIFAGNYNTDMVIVTIKENPYEEDNVLNENYDYENYEESSQIYAREYAQNFWDSNDFGIGSEKSGILYLIDMDTRTMWITTTGAEVRNKFDTRIQDILDFTYNKISNEKYFESCEEFIRCANRIEDKGNNAFLMGTTEKCLCVGVAPILITIIVIGIGLANHHTVKLQNTAKMYITKKLDLNEREDRFITRHVTRRKIESSSDGHGGGLGGSGSHGGGGRSF